MLIQSLRLYERILLGLESNDKRTLDAANTCLSWLILHMRNRIISLPPEIAARVDQLPDGSL